MNSFIHSNSIHSFHFIHSFIHLISPFREFIFKFQLITTVKSITDVLFKTSVLVNSSISHTVPEMNFYHSSQPERCSNPNIFLWVNSANHPGTVPLEQAKPDLKVAFEERRVTEIDKFLPVESMNVHSTFHAKPATGFWETLRSQKSKQPVKWRHPRSALHNRGKYSNSTAFSAVLCVPKQFIISSHMKILQWFPFFCAAASLDVNMSALQS